MTAQLVAELDALLVIDMQNSFLRPEGALYTITGAPLVRIDETIRAVADHVDAAERADVPLVYTRQTYRPGYVDAGILTLDRYPTARLGALLAGSWDADVIDELKRERGIIVDKPRMDAFYNTSLEVVLRGLGAKRLGVCGIVTNACVETTTRSATMRDFDVVVFGDGCTTATEEDQAASLSAMARFGFARVVPAQP